MDPGVVLARAKGEEEEEEEAMDQLPPGFRFHPSDEELVTHYLTMKVMDCAFNSSVIGEIDLHKCEPWELPWKAKMGEKEWYFFCVRDRKYPTGLRTNRATESGYWKATGKDKEIHRGKILVGMKKTLVFYRGRAPKGEKTGWVMHEYRLEGHYSVYNLPRTARNEWVICRVFNKSSMSNGKMFGRLMSNNYYSFSGGCGGGEGTGMPSAPPRSAHVTCFSNAMEAQKSHDDEMVLLGTHLDDYSNNPSLFRASANPPTFWDIIPSPLSSKASSSQFFPGHDLVNVGTVIPSDTSFQQALDAPCDNTAAADGGSLSFHDCLWKYD